MRVAALGPVSIGIAGSGPLADALRDELLAGVTRDAQRPDLLIDLSPVRSDALGERAPHVSRSRFPFKQAVATDGRMIVTELVTVAAVPIYRMSLDGHPYLNDHVRAQIEIPAASRSADVLTRPFLRAGTKDFSSLVAMAAKDVIYDLIDPLVWCMLLRRSATLVHSSAIRLDSGGGVAVMGGGGVGKSTAVLELVASRRCGYLGDDLVVLEGSGRISRHPKRLQVYGYNAALVPSIGSALQHGRSRRDRAAWRIRETALGPRRVRRRLDAASLFDPVSVADNALLRHAFLLSAGSDRIRSRRGEARHVAVTAASTILDEFWDFVGLLNAVSTVDGSAPNAADLHNATRSVIENALQAARAWQMAVPRGTSGAALADEILHRVSEPVREA